MYLLILSLRDIVNHGIKSQKTYLCKSGGKSAEGGLVKTNCNEDDICSCRY